MEQNIGERLGYMLSESDMDVARNSMRRAIMSDGPLIKTVTVPVDYDLTVEERNAAAAFDVAPDGVTSEAFPATRSGKAQLAVSLLAYGCYTFGREILTVLEARGLRPLEMAEMQSIAMHDPGLLEKCPMIALDPSRPSAILMYKSEGKLTLILHQGDIPIDAGWRFAATHK